MNMLLKNRSIVSLLRYLLMSILHEIKAKRSTCYQLSYSMELLLQLLLSSKLVQVPTYNPKIIYDEIKLL